MKIVRCEDKGTHKAEANTFNERESKWHIDIFFYHSHILVASYLHSRRTSKALKNVKNVVFCLRTKPTPYTTYASARNLYRRIEYMAKLMLTVLSRLHLRSTCVSRLYVSVSLDAWRNSAFFSRKYDVTNVVHDIMRANARVMSISFHIPRFFVFLFFVFRRAVGRVVCRST